MKPIEISKSKNGNQESLKRARLKLREMQWNKSKKYFDVFRFN